MHADILTPPTPQPDSPFAPPETASSGGGAAVLGVTGDGFVPGEDVAVALILRHLRHAHQGRLAPWSTVTSSPPSPER